MSPTSAVMLLGLNKKSVPLPSTKAPTRTSCVFLLSAAVIVVLEVVLDEKVINSEVDWPEVPVVVSGIVAV